MLQIRKKLSFALLIVSLLTCSISQAESSCPAQLDRCRYATGLCKEALDLRNEEIRICRLGLTQAVHANADLKLSLDDANAKLNSPLRNPFVIGTVGVLIGILVTGLATK